MAFLVRAYVNVPQSPLLIGESTRLPFVVTQK